MHLVTSKHSRKGRTSRLSILLSESGGKKMQSREECNFEAGLNIFMCVKRGE